jgi:hypothetical protein
MPQTDRNDITLVLALAPGGLALTRRTNDGAELVPQPTRVTSKRPRGGPRHVSTSGEGGSPSQTEDDRGACDAGEGGQNAAPRIPRPDRNVDAD